MQIAKNLLYLTQLKSPYLFCQICYRYLVKLAKNT